MAQWSRNKINSNELNGGNELDNSSNFTLDELNAVVNGGLYSQDFAEHLADTPDVSEVGNVGTPSVEIVDNVVNGKTYKKFKFKNLRGAPGYTPLIGDNENWQINGEDTGKPSRGEQGYTPTIGENGNWYINGEDTGKPSRGETGPETQNATNLIPDENGAVNPGGRGEGTVGEGSIAFGSGASASNINSVAIGAGATATGSRGIAIGPGASAGIDGVAIGMQYDDTPASASHSGVAIDGTASVGGVAIKGRAGVSGVAIGGTANGSGSVAIGGITSHGDCVAIGESSQTQNGINNVAIGHQAKTNGGTQTAIGAETSTSAGWATAVGYAATAEGEASSAIGFSAQCSGTDSHTVQLGDNLMLSALRCKVNLTVTSDERDKADINNITKALPFINKLNPVTFVSNDRANYISEEDKKGENYRKYGMCDYDRVAHALGTKKGERRRCGLLAQEVIAAMQEVYGTDNYANIVNDNFHDLADKPSDVENKYTLAYANLVPFLIGAIKELNAEIKTLKDKLNDNN